MSEWSLVKYTAPCPACQQGVEWTAMPVSVNNPAWTSQNRCGIEVRYSWRGCDCPTNRSVAA